MPSKINFQQLVRSFFRRAEKNLFALPKAALIFLLLICQIAVTIVDYETPSTVSFSVFFILILFLAAKFAHPIVLYFLALCTASSEFYLHGHFFDADSMWWHHGWHLTSNILIYFLISYLLNAYLSHSKQTQLKLNQTTEFNDALIEATQAGVLILNAQGEYVSSTARVTDMLGIPMHQLQDIKLEQTTQFFPAALSTTIQDTQRDQQRRRLTVSFHT